MEPSAAQTLLGDREVVAWGYMSPPARGSQATTGRGTISEACLP